MNEEAKQRKEKHELAIGNHFLKELQFDHTFVGHGKDDSEPDLIYQMAGRTVGVEIVAAYYHNDQDNKVITAEAQLELNKKCSKQYLDREVWLFVYLEAPLLEMHGFKELAAAITIPRHNFARIYFGFLNYSAGAKLVVEKQY